MPDQADGLRHLFARRRPSLLITAGGDPCKADVAVRFAREASVANRATVMIDGSVGQLARACGTACRYELAQVVDGHVSLVDVARLLSPNLLLLPAARALARVGSFTQAEAARLADAFAHGIARAFAAGGTADAQVDLVVVNAGEGRAASALEAFGSDARVVIVVSNRPSSLRAAYAEVRALAQDACIENFEVVVPVDGDSHDPGPAFENLANTARRFLGIELVDGGTIPVASCGAEAPRITSARASSESIEPSLSSHEEETHAAVH